MAGVKTTFLNVVSYANELLANTASGTGRISLADLSEQLSAEGPLAEKVGELETNFTQVGIDADRAEAARDAAFVAADVFSSVSEGLSGTSAGEQFLVVESDEIIRYRHDAGPVAIEVARYPAASRLDPLIQSAPFGYEWAVVDQDGRMAIGVDGDGAFYSATGRIPQLTSHQIGFDDSDVALQGQTPSGYAWVIMDQDGRSAAGLKDTGEFKVPALEADTLNGVSVASILAPDTGDTSIGDQNFQADITHLISYGQSLSVGVGTPSAITTSQRFNNLKFVGGVRAQDAGTDVALKYGSLVPLTETGPGAEGAYETPMGGATDAVIELVAGENAITYNSHQFQLLASAPGDGGRTIAELAATGGVFYSRLLDDVTYGLARAQEAGKSYKVGAIMWTQGESDGGNSDYAAELSALRTSLESDIKSITGQSGNIPMVCYQLPRAEQAEYYLQAMADDPLITVACPTYHLPKSDGVHLTSQSSKIMGAYYGAAYKRIVVDGNSDWRPCMAVDFFRQGKIVDVKFNIHGTSLEWDTTSYALQTNYGFRLFAPDGITELTVADVAITKRDTVRITAAANIPVGAILKYGTVDKDPVNAANYDITGGNLRDNSGDTTVLNLGGINLPMHHWALLFTRTL